ncbi:AWS [Nesidiocoris tenuis]|uniref:AWS n=2 Tax=Nesidiocoris tenuis TaxID=355587 RepID=A0ABN7A763_9HEMI|nr:AWS [Nesidiocoris tenuis]
MNPFSAQNAAADGDSSSQLSSDEGEEEDDEAGESRDEIANLARQLGAEGPDLISEQLQEINQEDLAAILPDVGGGSFDGFEEENAAAAAATGAGGTSSSSQASSSRNQVASPAPSPVTSSSSSESDTEQIVSDVISRIQDESESSSTKPLRLSQPPVTRGDRQEQSGRPEIYSSNLLADFVEKTELLSRGGSASVSGSNIRNDGPSTAPNVSDPSPLSKRKRGRPPKTSVKGASSSCRAQNQANGGMPELEAYMRLDCSQSNVSPDSGIQSVAGSPAGHHSLPGSPRSPPNVQNAGPPLLTKANSPIHQQEGVPSPNDKLTKLVSPPKELKLENGGKRGPGRPKHAYVINAFGRKKRGKRIKRVELAKKPIVLPPSATELKVPPYFARGGAGKSNLPTLPQISSKRGRGRPKKSPPVLEPILPLERRRDASNGSRKNLSSERIPVAADLPKLKDDDVKSGRSSTCKSLLKTKEHKHKKRKRSLDFRRLDPAFLKELSILAEAIERCCVISRPEPKAETSKKNSSQEKLSRKQRKNQREQSRRDRREMRRKLNVQESSSKQAERSLRKASSANSSSKKAVPCAKSVDVTVTSKKSSTETTTVKVKKETAKTAENKSPKASEASKTEIRGAFQLRSELEKNGLSKSKAEGKSEQKAAAKLVTKDKEQLPAMKAEDNSENKINIKSEIPVKETKPSRERTKDKQKKDNTPVCKEKPNVAKPTLPGVVSENKIEKDEKVSPTDVKDETKTDLIAQKVETISSVLELKQDLPKATVITSLPPKDKSPTSTPSKDKATASPVAKEKTSSPIKEKPATCKEKPTETEIVPPISDKVQVIVSSKEKPTAAAVKDKVASSPSNREKDKPTPVLHKEKKEAQSQPQKVPAANQGAASPHSNVKRRIKKTVVEPPKNKDKPEQASNNEQRLPLKKRHYHVSTSATSDSSSVDSAEKSDESSDSSKTIAELAEPVSPVKVGGESKEEIAPEEETPASLKEQVDVLEDTCQETEKKATPVVKSKERDISGKETPVRRANQKSANSAEQATPSALKRQSSRQAAGAKTADLPETGKSVKRSQRIKLKSKEEKPKEKSKAKDSQTKCANDQKVTKKTKEDKMPSTEGDRSRDSSKDEGRIAKLKGTADPITGDTSSKTPRKDIEPAAKRTTRSMDENASEEKKPADHKTEKTKTSADKSRHVSPISTRSSSRASVDTAIDKIDDNLSRSPRTRCDRKSLVGVFEPSVKVSNLLLPDPQCDVLNSLKSKLLSPDIEIDLEEELKNVKRPADLNGAEKPNKRKSICDVRVHVTKLDSDILLDGQVDLVASDTGDAPPETIQASPGDKLEKQNGRPSSPLSDVRKVIVENSNTPASPVPNKIKMKRKKINRTGFPVKRKKKKKTETVDASASLQTSLSSSIPEDEVKTDLESAPEDGPLPPQEKIPKVENKSETARISKDQLTDAKTDKSDSLRPASKRIMELKAKSEAVVKRKRKNTNEDASLDEPDSQPSKEGGAASDSSTDMKTFAGKRPRKTKEDLDDSDADSVRGMKKKQPRWRKKYLTAGLFSDYYKEDEPRKPSAHEKVKSLTYDKTEHENGLLPPPAYCAKWVRQRKIPFQLPYDIWWLHTHNQLSGREEVPSWNYRKLRTNVYFDVKPSYSYEAQACNCKPSDEAGCGEECINRMILAECSPQLCPCKEKCLNQKIQRHEWSPGLTRFMTRDKGWGIKTKYKIKKDTFILEYVGEVVSDREFKSRMASRYQKDTHHYCLNLDGGLVIDGHRMGGDGRFVNHSCEPNCEMQKWCVNGLFRMALFALRDIDPNEELSYDYNFALFNPAEGQPCKCGSTKCRGVIGGKSQRVALPSSTSSANADEKETKPGHVGRPRKSVSAPGQITSHRRKTSSVDKKCSKPSKDQKASGDEVLNASALATVAARLSHMTTLKPLTQEQKEFIIVNRIFLTRNLQKVKRRVEKLREAVKKRGLLLPELPSTPVPSPGSSSGAVPSTSTTSASAGSTASQPTNVKKEKEGEREVFMTQLTALNCPRSMKTRRLALAEDNPEMTKTARLACLFKDLYTEVISAKDESGELLSSHFTSLPSKKKFPLYYQRFQKRVDFTMIEQNIITGEYKTVEAFDDDMNTLFKNNIRWYGRTSDLGIAATRLRKIYNLAKLAQLQKLEEVLGEPPPASFIPAQDDPSGEEEDVIHCICGIFRDEGVMIQCERCLVWQHCYCVGASSNVEKFLCERCSPREVNYEIPSQEEATAPNQFNYLTLLRGDMQLKQGDTVYVLRDIVNEESTEEPKAKHTYKTIKNWKYIDCDIFKIERLWKDETGKRFAFGHHYLRPHETFHEPTRKFFPNELMRVPLYEVVPIELVMGQCYVLDLNTYCKGRPIGCDPDHLYVCEYRVDKFARMFAKIPKPKHSNICTKSYAFETFDVRLKPQRTYAPHGLGEKSSETSGTNQNTANSGSSSAVVTKPNVSRGRGGRTAQHQSEEPPSSSTSSSASKAASGSSASSSSVSKSTKPKSKPVLTAEDKKHRLNTLTHKMLIKLPSKQPPLDLSYLLEPGRRIRKKPPILAS